MSGHEGFYEGLGRKFVEVESRKPREEWPKEGDYNYKRRQCRRGRDCDVSGCTFWHPYDSTRNLWDTS